MRTKIKNYFDTSDEQIIYIFTIISEAVVGDERYNKTKLPITDHNNILIFDGNNVAYHSTEVRLNSFERLEKSIYEFEKYFRPNYYVETPRYVRK